jgi:hypothetical protein
MENEELRKKARKRKEKVRALQKENSTLKATIRDISIQNVVEPPI